MIVLKFVLHRHTYLSARCNGTFLARTCPEIREVDMIAIALALCFAQLASANLVEFGMTLLLVVAKLGPLASTLIIPYRHKSKSTIMTLGNFNASFTALVIPDLAVDDGCSKIAICLCLAEFYTMLWRT